VPETGVVVSQLGQLWIIEEDFGDQLPSRYFEVVWADNYGLPVRGFCLIEVEGGWRIILVDCRVASTFSR